VFLYLENRKTLVPKETPTLSIPGLLDMLTVLEDELASCPGIVPLLSNTLREMLEEVVDDGCS
jgi:hypothetical protein